LTSSHAPGATFALGTTTVTYTATDGSGNIVSSSFDVIVEDNEVPVIVSIPTEITQDSDASSCDAVVTWTAPTATDNCSVTLTSSHAPGATFALGTTTVTYTATDGSSNVVSSSFDVIVNDITPQVFDFCPTTVDVAEFDVSTQTAVVTWQEPTATDNCVIPGISSDYYTGDSFPAGRTIVTYTATYGSGSIATCEISVDVIGNKLPVASPMSINTYAGEPLEICLKVVDPDGDNMVITAVDYDNLNGTIEPLKSDGSLCFIYTSFNDFEGDELLYVTVCDNGVPSACIETEVQVSVAFDLRLTFYKAFTPNNDNINDVWVIENIENHPNNQVTIFDRLGGVVYSAKGYNNLDIVWDGRSNQNSQDITPTGTYFYKIDLENDESTLKGYVELIR
jgi:gliding motility-associated-like protein